MPKTAGQVALVLAVSLPAVLPSSSELWVMSRTSSTIWKARPAFSPKVRRRAMVSALAAWRVKPLAVPRSGLRRGLRPPAVPPPRAYFSTNWLIQREAAGDDAGGDEGSGFGAVDGFDELGGGGSAFGFDVDDLAADHAGREGGFEISDAAYSGADGGGDFAEDGDDCGWCAWEVGDGLEGEGLEGVAGEDGDGFAEDDVAGGLAAAEVVVVEGG